MRLQSCDFEDSGREITLRPELPKILFGVSSTADDERADASAVLTTRLSPATGRVRPSYPESVLVGRALQYSLRLSYSCRIKIE